MRLRRFHSLAVAGLVLAAAVVVSAFELKPATLAAYARYIELTDARVADEVAGRRPFLWLDNQPERERPRILQRLAGGEIVVESLETRDGGKSIDVADGLLHHWVGTILLPGVSIDDALSFVRDYDRYPQMFSPMIQRAVVKRHEGDDYLVSMRTWVKKVITVVMDADYEVSYRRLSPTRAHTTNLATDLYEVHDPGETRERREPGDAASGYLWRFKMYCKFEQRAEGTYEQCESVSLTRNAPFMLRLIVKPFITGIPREAIEFTLGQVRAGVTPRRDGAGSLLRTRAAASPLPLAPGPPSPRCLELFPAPLPTGSREGYPRRAAGRHALSGPMMGTHPGEEYAIEQIRFLRLRGVSAFLEDVRREVFEPECDGVPGGGRPDDEVAATEGEEHRAVELGERLRNVDFGEDLAPDVPEHVHVGGHAFPQRGAVISRVEPDAGGVPDVTANEGLARGKGGEDLIWTRQQVLAFRGATVEVGCRVPVAP